MTEDFAYSHNSTEAINVPQVALVFHLKVFRHASAKKAKFWRKRPGQGVTKRPDLDAEAFTADGFFKTGDQGKQRATASGQIHGRVKELFKTSKGKYVAPASFKTNSMCIP